jgi:hypothetical protein
VTTCVDVRGLIPEAALELLSGTERAEVLDHLDGCESCRELMHDLSEVADDLVLLAPNGEPPSGFEQRVLARIVPVRPRRRRAVVAGAIAAAVLAVVAFAAGRAVSSTSSVREVAMRAPSGEVVGDAYLHGGDPTWVFVAVPGWSNNSTAYRLRVTYLDGTTSEIKGSGSWGTVLPGDPEQVRELAVIGDDGSVWCTALLTA